MLIFGGVLKLFIWIFSTDSSILNQKVWRINSFLTVGFLSSKSHPNMVNGTVVILSLFTQNIFIKEGHCEISPCFNIISLVFFVSPDVFFTSPQKKSAFQAVKGHAPKVGFQNGTWLWTKKIHWRTTRLVSFDSHLSFLRRIFSKWINGLRSNRGLDLLA